MIRRYLSIGLALSLTAFLYFRLDVMRAIMAPATLGTFTVAPAVAFGEVAPDKLLSGDIFLENRTHTDVLIDRVATSCGCLAVEKSVTVRANETHKFAFQIRTPKQFGNFRHEIIFHVGNIKHKANISGKVMYTSYSTTRSL